MKKYGFGWILLDILLLLISLINVLAGAPQPGDYFALCCAGFLLVLFIGEKIYEEIQIQKRCKQICQERAREKENGEKVDQHG